MTGDGVGAEAPDPGLDGLGGTVAHGDEDDDGADADEDPENGEGGA